MTNPATDEVLLFVDAIDGGHARLLRGEEAFDVPVRLLPAGAREGAWLSLSLKPPGTVPEKSEELRRKLRRDDDGGDIKL